MSFQALPFHVFVGPFNPSVMLAQKWYSSCLSDARCLGAYLHHPQVHPFFTDSAVFAHSLVPGAKPQAEAVLRGPRLTPGEDFYLQPVIDKARTQHPVDRVLWWGLQNGLPLDVATLDTPLFVVMSDWHNAKPLARLFQSVAGVFCDEKLRQCLTQEHAGLAPLAHKVKYWPAYSFDPALVAQVKQPVERDIDVLFVGNTNPHKYVQRNQLLFRIANLPDVNLHVTSGISEAAHLALLQRSKIAFNHGLRQEMNLRAYEATACGALLLMESENLEVNTFLSPGIAYVPYTQHNLEAQIQYYLAHPEARERIAQQGQKAIQPCHYTARFGALLALLQESWSPHDLCQKPTANPQDSDAFLLAHALVHMTGDLAVLRTDAARQLERRSQQLHFTNALLVALTDLWVQPVTHERLPRTTLKDLQGVLETGLFSAHGLKSLHVLVAYNLAWSYFFQADYVGVERVLLRFQTLVDVFTWQTFAQEVSSSFFVLPVRYTGLYLLYQEAALEQAALERALRAGVFFLQGCVLRSQQKNPEAAAAFEHCIGLAPRLAEAYFELAGVWMSQGAYVKAEQCLAQGLFQGVFFKSAWKKYLELLERRGLSLAEQSQYARLRQALERLSLDA